MQKCGRGFLYPCLKFKRLLASRDDVLTYLIHLGYLGYDEKNQTAFIPNEEIRQELMKAVKRKKWNEWMSFQQESDACSQSGI